MLFGYLSGLLEFKVLDIVVSWLCLNGVMSMIFFNPNNASMVKSVNSKSHYYPVDRYILY